MLDTDCEIAETILFVGPLRLLTQLERLELFKCVQWRWARSSENIQEENIRYSSFIIISFYPPWHRSSKWMYTLSSNTLSILWIAHPLNTSPIHWTHHPFTERITHSLNTSLIHWTHRPFTEHITHSLNASSIHWTHRPFTECTTHSPNRVCRPAPRVRTLPRRRRAACAVRIRPLRADLASPPRSTHCRLSHRRWDATRKDDDGCEHETALALECCHYLVLLCSIYSFASPLVLIPILCFFIQWLRFHSHLTWHWMTELTFFSFL